MKIEELLPIGSVVRLKEAEHSLMIYGVKQTDEESNKEYDYISVPYPEGTMGEGSMFLFNHEDIDKIEFRGYETEDRKAFIAALANYYNNLK